MTVENHCGTVMSDTTLTPASILNYDELEAVGWRSCEERKMGQVKLLKRGGYCREELQGFKE